MKWFGLVLLAWQTSICKIISAIRVMLSVTRRFYRQWWVSICRTKKVWGVFGNHASLDCFSTDSGRCMKACWTPSISYRSCNWRNRRVDTRGRLRSIDQIHVNELLTKAGISLHDSKQPFFFLFSFWAIASNTFRCRCEASWMNGWETWVRCSTRTIFSMTHSCDVMVTHFWLWIVCRHANGVFSGGCCVCNECPVGGVHSWRWRRGERACGSWSIGVKRSGKRTGTAPMMRCSQIAICLRFCRECRTVRSNSRRCFELELGFWLVG